MKLLICQIFALAVASAWPVGLALLSEAANESNSTQIIRTSDVMIDRPLSVLLVGVLIGGGSLALGIVSLNLAARLIGLNSSQS